MYHPKIYGFKIFGKRGSKYENMKLGELFPEDKVKEKDDKEKEKEKEKS